MRVERSKSSTIICVLLVLSANISAQNPPNCVRNIVYNVGKDADGKNLDLISKSYTNGLGQEIQGQTRISGSLCMISTQEYDERGRPWKSYKPFLASTGLTYFTGDPEEAAKSFYSEIEGGEKGFPFSETQYYDDPLGRVKAAGAPGFDYSIGQHPVKTWYIGTAKDPKNPTPHQDSRGFLNSDGLKILTGEAEGTLELPDQKSTTHFLTVSSDADGNLSQSMANGFGNVVLTWSNPGLQNESGEDNANASILAEYKHDIRGNIVLEMPPKDKDGNALIGNTTITYNGLGAVVKHESPDRTLTEYGYDKAGRLCYIVTPRDRAGDPENPSKVVYTYDHMGREISVAHLPPGAQPGTDEGIIKVRRYYDDVENMDPEVRSRYGIPEIYLSFIDNARGRLFAEVYYCENGQDYIVELYDYNPEGDVIAQYKIIPGLPVQEFTYSHDNHGKQTALNYHAGDNVLRMFSYRYDQQGRLKQVKKGGTPIVEYTYDGRGLPTQKTFYDKDGNAFSGITTDYNIRDWVTGISENDPVDKHNRYSEALDYVGVLNPSYRGNIQSVEHKYDGSVLRQKYEYDGVNRLDGATAEGNGDVTVGDYDEDFVYDAVGRFVSKRTGAENTQRQYRYYGQTNRLKNVTGGEEENYVYDENGCLILDIKKRMLVEYDYRDLPVQFLFFNDLPAVNPDERGECGGELSVILASYEPVSEVTMVYDASGNRVLKVERSSFAADESVYDEDYSGAESLEERGYSKDLHWGINTTTEAMRTTETAGGWNDMATASYEEFSVARDEGVLTIDWSVRFPTDNSGPAWREQNKIWFSLLDANGDPAYTLRFKPNRRQDLQTSPDMKLYESKDFVGIQEASTRRLTPSGNVALPVSFRTVIYPEGLIEVFYDARDGAGLERCISARNVNYNSFHGLQFQYKTGNPGTDEHYYVEVHDVKLNVGGEPHNIAQLLNQSTRATAYVDGFAVFQQKEKGGNLRLAHTNISTAVGGIEGRIDYSGDDEQRYFYLKDHLGSTRMVVSEEVAVESVKEAVAYTAYGEIRPIVPLISGNNPAREKFTGKEFDREGEGGGIRLFYHGARYYDPVIGLWTAVDPKSQFYSSYAYHPNPISNIDPDGKDAIPIVFPDYKITFKKEMPYVGWKRFGLKIPDIKTKLPHLGHAGVLLIDNKTGTTKYYEYGRYDKPMNRGIVRKPNISDVVMGENGLPTQESLAKVMKEISEYSTHGSRIEGAYIKNDNFKAMNDYALSGMALNSDPDRKAYHELNYQCGTFMCDVIEAGGAEIPSILDPRPNSMIEAFRDDYTNLDWSSSDGFQWNWDSGRNGLRLEMPEINIDPTPLDDDDWN